MNEISLASSIPEGYDCRSMTKRKRKPKTPRIIIPDFNAPSPLVKQRYTEVCIPFIRRCSVAIGIFQNDVAQHHCSGTLYAIAGEHFVLTASHCVEGRLDPETHFYVCVDGVKVIPLFPDDVSYTDDSNDDYCLDVAAFRLKPEGANQLRDAGKQFIDQRYLRDDDGLGLCMFYGYPKSLCIERLRPRGLCLIGPRNNGNSATWRKQIHVLLESMPMITNVATEEKEEMPDLDGISGCGIWRVCDLDSSDRPIDVMRFVGVEHHVGENAKFRPTHIKATQVQYIHRLLLWRYPELKIPMSLLFWTSPRT